MGPWTSLLLETSSVCHAKCLHFFWVVCHHATCDPANILRLRPKQDGDRQEALWPAPQTDAQHLYNKGKRLATEANLSFSTTRTVEVSLLEFLQVCQTAGKKRTSDALIPFPNKTDLYLSKLITLHPHPPGLNKTCLNCSLQRPWWRAGSTACDTYPDTQCCTKCCVFCPGTRRAKFERFRSTQHMLNMELIATQLLEGLSSAMVNGWVHQT